VKHGGGKIRVELYRQKLNAYLRVHMWEPNSQRMGSREGFRYESEVAVCDVDRGETLLRIPEHSPGEQLVRGDPCIPDEPSSDTEKA
jgi:hypothetical protein